MRSWLGNYGVSFGVSLAVVAVAWLVVSSRPALPPIEIRPLEASPTLPPPIYIHVDGAVTAPGVYPFLSGARVFEAIEAAGGATEDAELGELNLAARVADGQKLVIPVRRPPPEASLESVTSPAPATNLAPAQPAAVQGARINLNTATQRILETLPGIGPVTAQRIIDYRQTRGPFTRVDQLREARLVNTSVFERVRDLVSVD